MGVNSQDIKIGAFPFLTEVHTMITWKEYLIMQFLNTVTFLIIQEFFWLKMRKRFDNIIGTSKGVISRNPLRGVHERVKAWKEREKEAILRSHRR